MEYTEKITREKIEEHLKGICGIGISHVWMGYANALFLECGELKEEVVGRRRMNNLKGQVTFMLECDWRLENTRSILCGRDSSERKIDSQIKKLIGRKISEISLVNRIPELLIGLDNHWLIQTFTGWDTYPHWCIGYNDPHKIAVHPEWKKEDMSVWLSYEEKAFRRSFCFDDEAFRNKNFLQEYCK